MLNGTTTRGARTANTTAGEGWAALVRSVAPDSEAVSAPARTIADALACDRDLARFAALARATGLHHALASDGPFVVFAPDDAALERLTSGVSAAWPMPRSRGALTSLVSYHVVGGTDAAILSLGHGYGGGPSLLETLEGGWIGVREGIVYDERGHACRIVSGPKRVANGIVHVVDGVLLPR